MLQSLHVRNLAIVEDLTIEFEPGMNVITGETGAGKSVFVGALNLLMGERADRTLIRSGEDQCVVEAAFHLKDAREVDAVLHELGLAACDDGQLLVRRIVSAAGGGRNFINDGPATAQALKRLGDALVDMHGPHDHQSLLSPRFQVDLLDAFGRLEDPRAAYVTIYRRLLDLEERRRALEGDDQQVAQQLDLLAFQVRELESAGLVAGEDAEVEKEQAVLANARQVLDLGEAIRMALSEGDSSAFNALAQAQRGLSDLARIIEAAAGWRDEAKALAVRIQELGHDISDAIEKAEADPQRLQWLEERMAVYHRLKRKYGLGVPDLIARLADLKVRLHDLQTRGEQVAAVAAEIAAARAELADAGKKLSRRRQTAAGKLAEAVTGELRKLGFQHGGFSVGVTPAEPGPVGMDTIEFGFAPNVGEPSRPLRTIASSGEISRVMLATKSVLAAHDRIPVLVFDEIDVNIGGPTANAVGSMLGDVARTHQVLCITHLPQVAVHGATHFAVTKEVAGNRTRTRISRLDEDGRAEEVARMLGGRDLTSVTLKHAREMLRKARS